MEAQNINLVVVTSVTHPHLPSVYTAKDRFDQLTKLTIPSIKEKIPNYYLVVIEGNNLSLEERQKLIDLGVKQILFLNLKNFQKSYGELFLLNNYFKSSFFEKIKQSYNILTVIKISARYYLTPDFSFKENEFHALKIDYIEWTKKGAFETKYYQFPFEYFNTFQEKLDLIENKGILIDIEHSFYENEVIPSHKINNITKLNIAGNIAPSGQYINL